MENKNSNIEKRKALYAIFIPFCLTLCLLLIFILEKGMEWNFVQAGIHPRQLKGLYGIITHGFIHANWSHLWNNCSALFILTSFICYFYRTIELKILFYSYICSGILLWLIGRPSWHIGASGLVYALSFFLFFSGIFRNYIPLIAIALSVVFLYGHIVWQLFPWEDTQKISWEGHLAGAISGTILSIVYRKEGPQKPAELEEEDSNKEENDYWKIEEKD